MRLNNEATTSRRYIIRKLKAWQRYGVSVIDISDLLFPIGSVEAT